MKWSVFGVLAAMIFSGCASIGGAEDTAGVADDVKPITPMAVSEYLHNMSELIPDIPTITLNMRTSVSELIELDTWIIRPDIEGPVPTVLEITPYYGGGNPDAEGNALASFGRVGQELVGRGYAVGISSVRGTGNSGGCFTQGGSEEARDSADVIEHVASQEWSNGNVGLMGVSYPGTTPQDVWVEAPPALKTIVPISGISDLYKYNFVNGVPINVQGLAFNAYYWALVGASPAGLSGGAGVLGDPTHVATASAGEACADQVDVQEGGASSTLDGNKDAYWQERDFHAELIDSWDLNPARASVFYVHGLQDWNVKPHMMQDWLPAIQESGVDYKIWIGQWGHAWPGNDNCAFDEAAQRGQNCRIDWWTQTMVAWFDYYLKEIDTGILDAPPVQVQNDDGVWRHENEWPPVDVAWHRFGMEGDQLIANADGSGMASYVDPGTVQAETGPAMPVALPADGPDRVVFRSEPMYANWSISGLPVFHGNVTAEGQRSSLILSLAEELPDGTLRSFNFAAQSLNHVKSLESGDDDISGERQELHLQFFPQDDVLHKGNRLVLIASHNTVGSPGPGLIPVSDGGKVTLDLAGAWLELPVDHTLVFEDPQPYLVA